MGMSSKKRMLAAIEGRVPDRLPVTTHHVMPYFLERYMDSISVQDFFTYFDLDPILWIVPHKPDETIGEFYDPQQLHTDLTESRRISSNNWRIKEEEIPDNIYKTKKYEFFTPSGRLKMIMQSNAHTAWVVEYLIKNKKDIDIIEKYMTTPKCDVEVVNKAAEDYGEQGLIRGHVCCFDVFGQPGCWQDACCLFGVERMIMETYDDPKWVHNFLSILQKRKIGYLKSTRGAKYDLMELGGGDASTTVISPKIFNEFVAPYDSELIRIAHAIEQRIVYHTCGGMMPILEDLAAMKPDALETFTPPGMGGDTDLLEAKKRIGDKVCMIGGFDQFHYFNGCTPAETAEAVRKCFEEAGGNGGHILSASDHFFDADLDLIKAFADEAKKCIYE